MRRTTVSPAALATLPALVALPVLTALLAVLALAACGGERSRFLSLGTAPTGGAFFVVGGAIAETLNAHPGEPPWSVTAEATRGSQENIRRLVAGDIDLALSNAAITYFAVRGTEGWERPYPVQAVMTLAPNVALFVTSATSGIRTVADLRGKRVVIGPEGAGFEYFVKPLLAGYGVGWDEMEVIYGAQSAAVDMLADGSAAAAFLGGAVPTASITQATAGQDIFFVPFDEPQRTKLIDDYLFFRPATIPPGTYRGQDAAYEGLDVGSMHLIAAASADEDLIYRVTRTIWENREEVTEKHRAGRAINERNVIRDTGVAFHPGAIRYYEEIGIWSGD